MRHAGPVRSPLLLTGPPAVGKSTTAMALARTASLAAMIDVDDIRQLVVGGHAAPWVGEEGRLQQELGVRNACDLARRFRTAGVEVILADVVTTATAELYRRNLPDVQIIRLRVPREEAHRRARLRPVYLTEREFDDLYALEAGSSFSVDEVVDVIDLDSDEQTDAVRMLWREARPVLH